MQPLPIGETDIYNTLFTILPEDRRKHMAIFGKSGVGKTTMMRNMIVWDLHGGLGVTVLDPHGSLIEEILEMIPRERTNDVIYFNPYEPERALGINILEPTKKEYQPLVVSSLISIFKKIWKESWGPRMEDILRNTSFALIEQKEPLSIVAISKLLTDREYRKKILNNVSNPAVKSFFRVYEGWNERFREEAISPVLNKVNAFITNPLLRDIIGQPKSSFDFRWMMDTNKIFLCNLSKGALGEDVSSLLGSLILTKISIAALGRQDIPEEERRPHFLYADEVQNFIYGVDFPTVLSEARKYKLTLVIATQTINQLPDETISAVFGNCATVISFRVSGSDAQMLKREFADVLLPASQLQDLPDYKVYIRTMIQGRPTGPHRVNTLPPIDKTGRENQREKIVKTSLERYSRPRAEIEARLNRFLTN